MDTVLFVDDEIMILNSLRRGLLNEEYKQFYAVGGEEALKIMEQEPISVIVTDMKMPGMTGLKLLNIVKEKYPNTIRIVLSGYTHLPQVLVTINQAEIFKFITKPWNLEEEFIFVIREAVEYYNFKENQRKSNEVLKKKNTTFQNMLKNYDDIIKENRIEVKQVIKMNNYVLRVMNNALLSKDNANMDSDILVKEVGVLRNTVKDIVSVIPTTKIPFTIKKLVEELKSDLLVSDYKTKLEVNIDESVGNSYKGKYNLILKLLKNIILLFINNSPDYLVSAFVVAEQSSDEHEIVTFILRQDKKVIKDINEIEKSFKLIKSFVEGMNGELSIKDVKENKVIVLRLEI